MDNNSNKPPGREVFLRPLAFLLEKLAWLTAACVAFGFFGKFFLIFELFSHFRIQQTALLILCAASLYFLNHARAFRFCLIAGLLLSASLVPFFIANPKRDSGSHEDYKLVSYNVLISNPNKRQVVEYLIQENPDFVFLYETDSNWINFLKESNQINDMFSCRQFVEDPTGYGGITFLSKTKVNIHLHSRIETPEAGSTSIEASFENRRGETIKMIGIHPPPPLSFSLFETRNQTFQFISQRVQSIQAENTIVCGDFNCTPWSPFYGQFLSETKLSSAAHGNGLCITWAPYGDALGLPIDHMLVGDNILPVDYQIGPAVGSDHRPLVLSFE